MPPAEAPTFDPEALPIPDLGLKCRGCGYLLAGLPRHICPECGRKIVIDEFIPRGDFPLVVLNGEAVLVEDDVRKLMSDYHIPFIEAKVVRESFELLAGMSAFAHGTLEVARDRYFEAIDLLRRRMLGQPMPPAPESVGQVEDWRCPGCGEENPGNFEVCWSCEKEHIADGAI